MSVYNKITQKQILIGRLDYGKDLLEELTLICQKEGINLGSIEAIGAVSKARFGYYDQNIEEYQFFDSNKNFEIVSLLGNISICDGEPMVHAHIVMADKDGLICGGHLASGTTIFACEFVITEYNGLNYIREHDEQTSLLLWKL